MLLLLRDSCKYLHPPQNILLDQLGCPVRSSQLGPPLNTAVPANIWSSQLCSPVRSSQLCPPLNTAVPANLWSSRWPPCSRIRRPILSLRLLDFLPFYFLPFCLFVFLSFCLFVTTIIITGSISTTTPLFVLLQSDNFSV